MFNTEEWKYKRELTYDRVYFKVAKGQTEMTKTHGGMQVAIKGFIP